MEGVIENQKWAHRLFWEAPLLGSACALIASISLADFSGTIPWWIVPLFCLVGALRWRQVTWWLAAVMSLWLGGGHSDQLERQERWRDEVRSESVSMVEVEGVVVGRPKGVGRGTVFSLYVSACDRLPAGVMIPIYLRGEDVVHGERLYCQLELAEMEAPRNPGEFDRRDFLWRQGAAVKCERVISLERHGEVIWRRPMRWAMNCREHVSQRITAGLGDQPREAQVIKAVVLGEKPPRTDPVSSDFRESGVMHLFAVSGLHVGMLVLLLGCFLRLFGVGLVAMSWVLIPLVVGYAAITGFPPAAVRAALMAVVYLLGIGFRRRVTFLNSMALTVLLVLAVDTQQLFQLGFQLSYGILVVIVVVGGFFQRKWSPTVQPDEFLPRRLWSRWQVSRTWLLVKVMGLIVVSFFAWLASAPLVGWHFRIFTPVSVLASLLLAPQVTILMGLAIVGLCVGLIDEGAEAKVNRANAFVAKSCVITVSLTSELPGGSWDLRDFFAKRDRLLIYDLGRGQDAVALNRGRGLLIDAGGVSGYRSVLQNSLRDLAMKKFDVLVTHPGGDACGGLESLLENDQVNRLWLPTLEARSQVFRRAVKRGQVLAQIPQQGIWHELGEGCRWRAMTDSQALDGVPLADDRALVIQVEVEGLRILLMSDAGYQAEQSMQSSGMDLKSDILIYGKNRREFGGGDSFLDKVSPQVVVAAHSDFPAELRIDSHWRSRVERRGCEFFHQGEEGAVEICFKERTVRGYLSGREFALSE